MEINKDLPPLLEAWGRDIFEYGKEMGYLDQSITWEEFLEKGSALVKEQEKPCLT